MPTCLDKNILQSLIGLTVTLPYMRKHLKSATSKRVAVTVRRIVDFGSPPTALSPAPGGNARQSDLKRWNQTIKPLSLWLAMTTRPSSVREIQAVSFSHGTCLIQACSRLVLFRRLRGKGAACWGPTPLRRFTVRTKKRFEFDSLWASISPRTICEPAPSLDLFH